MLHGRVLGAPGGATVLLQTSGPEGRWETVARVSLRGRGFAVTWHPVAGAGLSRIRFALQGHRGRLLAVGRARQVLVGRAPVLCLEATVGALTPGDGAIVGGVYVNGGPAPGIHDCSGGTVNVLDPAGSVVASQTVSEKQSYVFELPPGSYELREAGAGYCRGEAVVTAGKVTHADTECDVP